jgi:hypothetical protein
MARLAKRIKALVELVLINTWLQPVVVVADDDEPF